VRDVHNNIRIAWQSTFWTTQHAGALPVIQFTG